MKLKRLKCCSHRLDFNLIALAPLIGCLIKLQLETFIFDVLPRVAEAAQANQVLRLDVPASAHALCKTCITCKLLVLVWMSAVLSTRGRQYDSSATVYFSSYSTAAVPSTTTVYLLAHTLVINAPCSISPFHGGWVHTQAYHPALSWTMASSYASARYCCIVQLKHALNCSTMRKRYSGSSERRCA